jgi:hypothetical protein
MTCSYNTIPFPPFLLLPGPLCCAPPGFHEFAEFVAEDVGTVDSGLNSMVLANNNELVLLPINEPTFGTPRKSQIQVRSLMVMDRSTRVGKGGGTRTCSGGGRTWGSLALRSAGKLKPLSSPSCE